MKKIFTVLIHNKEYDVYSIEGKEHAGLNDTPNTWWVYYADRLPDGLLPSIDSDNWEPWSVGIKRACWDIHFVQRNTSKVKWNKHQFSNHIHCSINCNGKPFYEFSTIDMAFAMAKAQYMIIAMSEHPFNFHEPEKENGRKIYWYGLPATVRVKHNPWQIAIIPDYTNYPKEQWWKELKRRKTPTDKEFHEMELQDQAEEMQDDYINWGDAFSDGHIGWFRKDDDIKTPYYG